MNVASLELCKELYELSDWGSNFKTEPLEIWGYGNVKKPFILSRGGDGIPHDLCPAYDASFLLKKLTEFGYTHGHDIKLEYTHDQEIRWTARIHIVPHQSFRTVENTPENALAQLAITLFKEGVFSANPF